MKHRSKTFAIAEKVGVSVWTVRRYLRGNCRQWHNTLSDADEARAVEGLRAGQARSKAQPRRYAPPFGQLTLPFN